MPPSQLALPLNQLHRNQQLFSDHYLDVTLPQRPEWQALAGEAGQALVQITPLIRAFVQAPSGIEAQVEDKLIKPVLRLLGHTFEVQAALRTPDGTKRPDYVFYRDQDALDSNAGVVLDEAHLRGYALAVGDAKAWDRPLDVTLKGAGDPFSNKNPAYQIAFYIQHSGLDWGVLTNGRLWRLCHRETAHKQDRFYEVDLVDLIERDDPAVFLYFYAFFRRAAFAPGPLALDALLRESQDYARAVSASLKAQVYDALKHLAQGFLDYPANNLQPTPETLGAIYEHSLIVLYRLLFILYAEARELLPLRESEPYRRDYSLDAIKREIARRQGDGSALLPITARFWARLRDLFAIIHDGSPPLRVATFNGGLFDPRRYPFLERYSVGDARLLAAIDRLARVDGQFVDYRDLAERHLGTIYEGLLEFHLQPVPPADGWSVDLFNDKGERHRTGSYYTPDFVVQYIVEQTLRPALDAAVARAASDEEKIAAVLSVNCVDPAMGSGHFPVAAMEFIARYLLELGVGAGPDASGEADLAYWKRRVAQNCIYGVDLNPLAVDLAKLSLWLATAAKGKPLSFLDHHLRVGNALVGVRVAQLDLGAPAKKPARKSAAAPTSQLSMLDDPEFARSMSTAVSSMWLIEETAGNTIDEVREQERLYAELRQALTRRYQRLADVAAARAFGLMVDQTLWKGLVGYLAGGGFEVPQYAQVLRAAEGQAQVQRFFHWDLEFPEVFFDRHGQPLGERGGFDVVLGNPPYVRQEQLAPLKSYFAVAYPETYHGVADLYVYFYQQGLRLLQTGGRLSYIVTNKWMRAGYGEPLRAFFATQSALEQIIDFGHAPIFADADVFPCIIVVGKPDVSAPVAAEAPEVDVTLFPREALGTTSLDAYVAAHSYRVPRDRFGAAPWSLETSDVDTLMAKIRRAGVPLAQFAGVKPYRGVLTGLNEAFLIDTPTKERLIREDSQAAEIIKPYLRGQDIKRWSVEWDGLWLIVLKSSGDFTWPWSGHDDTAENIFQQTFPSLYQHMKPLEARLRSRQDKGKYWWELRACAYYDVFEKPKLFYQEIQFYSAYSFDTTGYFSNNKGFLLPKDDFYLLAVLNSPLMWWHNWRYLPHMKDEALNPAGFLVEQLPIAPPTDVIRAEVEPAVARLIALTREGQEARRDTLDWLRTEFGVEAPGQKLEDYAALSSDDFVAEVRKRRPKNTGPLSPAALRALRDGYTQQATPAQTRQAEARRLELRLAALVNDAYVLTPAEVELLWRTAPPRMPVGPLIEN